jgi:hypothetical protein
MAARGLGVHESTLRRWEEHGLIRAGDLRTGVRPLGREGTEALRAQTLSVFPPIVEEEIPAVPLEDVDR